MQQSNKKSLTRFIWKLTIKYIDKRKKYDKRKLFTQMYKTYKLLENQNPNKFTTHIGSSLASPKYSSLTCT